MIEWTKEDLDRIDQAYAELAAHENEVFEHNEAMLSALGRSARDDFAAMMEYCTIDEKIEIVDTPKGECQNESYGVFLEVFVEQWSRGMEGDSFSGYTYARVKSGVWWKIPYSC